MSPIDLETLTGCRFHAYISSPLLCVLPQIMQVIAKNRVSAAEPLLTKPLLDDRGGNRRVLLKPVLDHRLEWIELAGTGSLNGNRCRRLDQVFGDRSAADVEMTGNLANRPVLHKMQPMNRRDLLVRQHGLSLYEPIAAAAR